MNRIIYRRLKKLKVNQKREILKRCSKEIGIAIPQLFTCSDEEVNEIFDKVLEQYKEENLKWKHKNIIYYMKYLNV